jgi:hypothetical protein
MKPNMGPFEWSMFYDPVFEQHWWLQEGNQLQFKEERVTPFDNFEPWTRRTLRGLTRWTCRNGAHLWFWVDNLNPKISVSNW